MSAKVSGLQELDARFRRMRAAVKAANEAGQQRDADELVRAIAGAAPRKTGTLAKSVRKVEGVNKRGRPYVAIVAGGKTTTRKIRAGVKDGDFAKALVSGGNQGEFDYSRAVEFGAPGRPAEPFFYVTYRKLKRRLKARRSRVVKKAIAENIR